jgi:hypothetical protein
MEDVFFRRDGGPGREEEFLGVLVDLLELLGELARELLLPLLLLVGPIFMSPVLYLRAPFLFIPAQIYIQEYINIKVSTNEPQEASHADK